MTNRPGLVATVVLASVLFAFSAYGDYARKSTALLDAPARKADVVIKVEAGTELSIIEVKGIWLKASVGDQEGWVRKLHVSDNAPSGESGGGSLGDAASLGTGRKGSGNVVSTTGVRGLDADQLKSAEFNEEELAEYLELAVSPKKAEKFARAGGLEAQK